MNTHTQANLCRAYLYSTSPEASLRKGGPRISGPALTISREAGARGNSIAKALIPVLEESKVIPKYRPWTLFNQDLINHVIKEHNLPEKTAEYFPEDKPEEIRALIGEMLGLHAGNYTMVRKVAETVRRLAVAGNAIIVGRGANLVAANVPGALHVRFVGDEKNRVQHYSRLHDLTTKAAAEEVAKHDRGRKRYHKANFGRDIEDACQYDLVINTSRFDDNAVARIVCLALEEKFR